MYLPNNFETILSAFNYSIPPTKICTKEDGFFSHKEYVNGASSFNLTCVLVKRLVKMCSTRFCSLISTVYHNLTCIIIQKKTPHYEFSQIGPYTLLICDFIQNERSQGTFILVSGWFTFDKKEMNSVRYW